MKKTFPGKFLFTLLAIAVMLLNSFTVSAQRANFSGDWKLDESKSELGEFGARVARSIITAQKADSISIIRTTPGWNGGDPVTTTITLPFDGKVVESEGFGGSKRNSTAKWSDDGKTLTFSSTTKFERDGESFEFKSTENWTVTSDGVLTIATNSTSSRGDSSTKGVYTK